MDAVRYGAMRGDETCQSTLVGPASQIKENKSCRDSTPDLQWANTNIRILEDTTFKISQQASQLNKCTNMLLPFALPNSAVKLASEMFAVKLASELLPFALQNSAVKLWISAYNPSANLAKQSLVHPLREADPGNMKT